MVAGRALAFLLPSKFAVGRTILTRHRLLLCKNRTLLHEMVQSWGDRPWQKANFFIRWIHHLVFQKRFLSRFSPLGVFVKGRCLVYALLAKWLPEENVRYLIWVGDKVGEGTVRDPAANGPTFIDLVSEVLELAWKEEPVASLLMRRKNLALPSAIFEDLQTALSFQLLVFLTEWKSLVETSQRSLLLPFKVKFHCAPLLDEEWTA